MKKGQVLEGIVERVVFPNKGIVSVEGEEQKVIVKNAIEGQKIRFSINKKRKGKAEGRLLEVIERSPLQTEEECAYFGKCGGCMYQGVPYQEQLKIKETQVKNLLAPVLLNAGYELDEIFEGVKESPRSLAYRNKMEFSFGDEVKDGPLSLGMHKRGSFHDIVTVDGCRIVDEDYSKILRGVLDFFTEHQVPFYHKMSHVGYLRHLLVRKAVKTGEILIDLVTTTQPIEGADTKELLSEMAATICALELEGTVVGILHTENDSVADAVINEHTELLYGQDHFEEELLGLQFSISPFSFFQTNSLGAEVLYETAREYVADAGNGKIVYDLYSGTGTIAQILAPVAKEVIGVEIIEEAVEAAKENAKRNRLGNCEFLAGDVLKVLDDIEQKPDFIVLDPPRDGIHPKALEKIISYGVEKMVYISCKPTSLARDLEVLLARGYEAERICCVDMFPQTTGIENVCLLGKRKPDAKVKIGIDMDDYYRIRENAESK
ncbi:MAG TPA: 23S rRNA (uracil(1939)-C(5))-methyltransferase RlmD [Lachnospiraceae bacterium]|nr:23S rRNA (uracil(1939)-C(5))-methyltransferase RlmD [Lachnospiraceae bacterium]